MRIKDFLMEEDGGGSDRAGADLQETDHGTGKQYL